MTAPVCFDTSRTILQEEDLSFEEKVCEIGMYGMAGACIGSRPHNVGGPESGRRGSIEFAFRVRQKKNVLGR